MKFLKFLGRYWTLAVAEIIIWVVPFGFVFYQTFFFISNNADATLSDVTKSSIAVNGIWAFILGIVCLFYWIKGKKIAQKRVDQSKFASMLSNHKMNPFYVLLNSTFTCISILAIYFVCRLLTYVCAKVENYVLYCCIDEAVGAIMLFVHYMREYFYKESDDSTTDTTTKTTTKATTTTSGTTSVSETAKAKLTAQQLANANAQIEALKAKIAQMANQ